jgi:NADPH-dependent curcumin reductase CurA
MLNTQVCLKSRPEGIPEATHFEIRRSPVPSLREGQVLVRNDFLSVELAMRGWVSPVANYSEPVGIGEVMRSFAAGEVIASKHPGFAVGDKVMGMLGWQEYALAEPGAITRKVLENDLPLSLSLGCWDLTA